MKPFFTFFLTFLMVWNLSAQATKKSGNQPKSGQLPQTMIFTKVNEPNDGSYNPNADQSVNQNEYQLSPIKKR